MTTFKTKKSQMAASRFPLVGGVMGSAALGANWKAVAPGTPQPTTYAIGNGFLNEYLLPFELASVVLLAALIGAVVLSRKELK